MTSSSTKEYFRNNCPWYVIYRGGKGSTADLTVHVFQDKMYRIGMSNVSWLEDMPRKYLTLEAALLDIALHLKEYENWPSNIKIIPKGFYK